MSKGDSVADKRGAHKVSRVHVPSLPGSAPLTKPAFSKSTAPVVPAGNGKQSAPQSGSPVSGLGPAGQKALMFRARRELAPLEDPNQSIAE